MCLLLLVLLTEVSHATGGLTAETRWSCATGSDIPVRRSLRTLFQKIHRHAGHWRSDRDLELSALRLTANVAVVVDPSRPALLSSDP